MPFGIPKPNTEAIMFVVHIPSWFPIPEKPLNGNFIFRHIESLGDGVRSVVLHHLHDGFQPEMPSNATLFPVMGKHGKIGLFKEYLSAFNELVRQHGRPDILHLHVALPLGPVASEISRKHRIPLVVSEHWTGYLPMNRPKLPLTAKLMLRKTFHNADHITAVSQNLLDNITATVPVAAKKPQTVVGNVVDTKLVALKDSNPSHGRKRILHVSTLDNDAKNIMGILRAVKQLSARRNDFALDIVHDFRNEEAERFVNENSLSETVRFLGRKTSAEIAGLLQQSAFFLLFSNYENQPCVLLESFCTGTPVVTTPVGGILEITNEQNAVIVEPKDESQLIEKMDLMLSDSGNYPPQPIREQALNICSPTIIGKKWLNVYRSTLTSTP